MTCLRHLEHARDTSAQVQNLYIKLQQDYVTAMPFLPDAGRIQNRTHMDRMQDTSGVHAGCIWDACKCYPGAELYHTSAVFKSCTEASYDMHTTTANPNLHTWS